MVGQFFGDASGFVEMIVRTVPSPAESGAQKTKHDYTGDLNTKCAKAMTMCDASGPLMINLTKNYARPDCTAFDSFGRVFSGTVKVGHSL